MWTSEPSKTLLDRLRDEYVADPVNYVLSYSNVAVALLGLMIEQVCDTEFSAYMEQSVFDAIGMHWFSAERIEPSTLPKSWKNMEGKYQIINPDPESTPQDIILSSKDNLLVFNFRVPLWRRGKSNINLSPISETEAVTMGIGRHSGETMRLIDIEGKPGLMFWGYKMKKKTPE